jgi:hypothetical protein
MKNGTTSTAKAFRVAILSARTHFAGAAYHAARTARLLGAK